MNKKLILDACCGGRQFWFQKQQKETLFCDCRTMKPTKIGNGVHARIRKCLEIWILMIMFLDWLYLTLLIYF